VIIPDFIDHLREIHNITEITDHDILVREFTIREEEFTAECRTCNSSIDYEMYLRGVSSKKSFGNISRKQFTYL